MVDVFEVAKLLVAHAVGRFGDEISIVAYYGSHATGDATPDSDLDIFYIPVEGKTPDAARSFVIDGVTFDFWPITWANAQRIAEGEFRSWAVAPSILANSRVLHARSEEDRTRLEALQRRISLLQSPEEEPQMVRRALNAFPSAAYQLDNLRLACDAKDAAAIRECGWRVVTTCMECLALVNQVTFDGGWARALEEAFRLTSRPRDLRQLTRTVTTSTDPSAILTAAHRLVADTRRILRERQEAHPSGSQTADVFRGAYAEIHEHLQKLRSACKGNDPVRASLEARLVQDDVSRMLASAHCKVGYGEFNRPGEYRRHYRDMGLPDLMAAFDPTDLSRLADLAVELDKRLQAWLEVNGIDTCVFEGLDELRHWLGIWRPGLTE